MTSLQGIQASSWSHVHVTPDVMLASVYLALCGIAYDTPPGRCPLRFPLLNRVMWTWSRLAMVLPHEWRTVLSRLQLGCSLSTTVATYEAV